MLKGLMRIGRLPASDWKLLIVAALGQLLTAAALRTMALPRLRRGAARLRPLARVAFRGPEERVIWAIEASGRRLRGISTCLVRALLADLIFGSGERPLRLSIGIKRTGDGQLLGHAWVGDTGRVLIGESEAEDYEPVVAWESLGS